MTTSERDITDSDGTEADWFDMGSGRIELRRAAKAGLLLDEGLADYVAADPAAGGDVRTLNMANMADNECLQTCEWTRTFTGTSTGVGTWTVSVENLSDGLTLDADVDTIAVTDGGTDDVTVTATVANGMPTDEWLFGTLVLTPPAGSTAPVAHLPVGVLPSAGVLPTSIDVTTRRDAGSQLETDLEAIAITDLQIDASGLVPEDAYRSSRIVEDSTNGDAFDGNGTTVTDVEVPAGATSLIAQLENPTAPDFDLYVGTRRGLPRPTSSARAPAVARTRRARSPTPRPATYWVLVQNWEASTPAGTDTTDLVTAVVGGRPGQPVGRGPRRGRPGRHAVRHPYLLGRVRHGRRRDLARHPDRSAPAPASAGDIGVIPVTLNRVDGRRDQDGGRRRGGPG